MRVQTLIEKPIDLEYTLRCKIISQNSFKGAVKLNLA